MAAVTQSSHAKEVSRNLDRMEQAMKVFLPEDRHEYFVNEVQKTVSNGLRVWHFDAGIEELPENAYMYDPIGDITAVIGWLVRSKDLQDLQRDWLMERLTHYEQELHTMQRRMMFKKKN